MSLFFAFCPLLHCRSCSLAAKGFPCMLDGVTSPRISFRLVLPMPVPWPAISLPSTPLPSGSCGTRLRRYREGIKYLGCTLDNYTNHPHQTDDASPPPPAAPR
ncbi:hypothetical protein BJ875DRAFT_114906 [Amylocarpus encephaloides]|uniref:Secreted protein n=1 Tax=Amylocarpus encephaloides TaxID=45428 RepID=A0A9P7YQN5_9HELO|nr:hypothetical protein BJ875DRAFT_114906 [Amylocarpus encephaloides]